MSKLTHRLTAVRAGWLSEKPLIGRLSFPILENSRSGVQDNSVLYNRLSNRPPSPGSFVPAFQYEANWIQNGFPIGADLKFDTSIQLPPPGRRLFGFLADRSLSPRLMMLFSDNQTDDPRLPENAGSDEASGLLLPHPEHAFGGLIFEPIDNDRHLHPLNASGDMPESLRRLRTPIHRSTEFDETIYAFHAAERGKASPRDIAFLRRALALPGRSPVFSVLRNNEMQTARLRCLHDPVDRPLWLYIALDMARDCGIPVVDSAIEREMGETVFIQRRVDRAPHPESPDGPRLRRLPVFTAASLVPTHRAGSTRPIPFSYLAMADILNRDGAAPATDLPMIWRRLVYRLMTGGACADTPRTWLFTREALGWRLLPAHTLEWISPAFSSQVMGAAGVLPTFQRAAKGLTIDGRQILHHPEEALAYAPYFGLSPSEGKMILMELMRVLSGWENRVYDLGADPTDVMLMSAIFDVL